MMDELITLLSEMERNAWRVLANDRDIGYALGLEAALETAVNIREGVLEAAGKQVA